MSRTLLPHRVLTLALLSLLSGTSMMSVGEVFYSKEEAFELALLRKPTAAERARLERFQAENNTTLMASVLLNLDEFITRE